MTNLNTAPVRTLAEVPHQVVPFTNKAGEASQMFVTAGTLDTMSTEFMVVHEGGVDPVDGTEKKAKVEFYGFFTPKTGGEMVKIRVWAFDPALVATLAEAKDERLRLILGLRAAKLTPYEDKDGESRLSMTLVGEIRGKEYTEVVEAKELSRSTWAKALEEAFA